MSPEIALKQIEEKGYDKPFQASGKQIVKLGINFSSETKTVDGWPRLEMKSCDMLAYILRPLVRNYETKMAI